MPEADKPGEATSRRRSLLLEQLAELERVLDGIELDPERKSMLRAAGYRTCVGIAWQASRKMEREPEAPLPQAALGQPVLGAPSQPPTQPPLPPSGQPRGLPAPPTAGTLPVPSPPLGGEGHPQPAAGAWAHHVMQQLADKQLTNASYAALCHLMGIEKGSGIYPAAEDCLMLSEQEAYDVTHAQPRTRGRPGGQQQQQQRGGWRR